jgi:hypothetical protein
MAYGAGRARQGQIGQPFFEIGLEPADAMGGQAPRRWKATLFNHSINMNARKFNAEVAQ